MRRLIVDLVVSASLLACVGTSPSSSTGLSETVSSSPSPAATPLPPMTASPVPASTPRPTLTPISASAPGLRGHWTAVEGAQLVASEPLAVPAGSSGVLFLPGYLLYGEVPCTYEERNGAGTAASFYDSRTSTITTVKGDPQLQGFGAVSLKDGRVLIAGGYDPTGRHDPATPPAPTPRTRSWDPRTRLWAELAPMRVARAWMTVVAMADGRAMAIGGWQATPDGGEAETPSVEIYDPSSDRWTLTEPLELQLPDGGSESLGQAVALASGGVLAVGFETAKRWDPDTGTWASVKLGLAAPWSLIALPDGTLLNFDTQLDDDFSDGLPSATLLDAEGNSRVVAHIAPAPAAAIGILTDGRMIFAGGDSDHGFLTTALIFDPKTGGASQIASMPSGRVSSAAVALRDGSVLVAGGARFWESAADDESGGDDTPGCVPMAYRVIRWIP